MIESPTSYCTVFESIDAELKTYHVVIIVLIVTLMLVENTSENRGSFFDEILHFDLIYVAFDCQDCCQYVIDLSPRKSAVVVIWSFVIRRLETFP